MTPTSRRRSARIPRRLLIASGPLGRALSASAVAAAIARGLRAGGLPESEVCPLPLADLDGEAARALLEEVDFDARMRSARAVIVAAASLDERTLAGSITFEIATRARQSGVPAYALTGENRLNPFDARMLDLQVILQARSARSLAAAGQKLAGLL